MINILSSAQVEAYNITEPDYIFTGLERGGIGMLLSIPGIGKSHFIHSLAIELACGRPLLKLNKYNIKNKVIILSCEDTLSRNSLRLKDKYQSLNDKDKKLLSNNLDFIFDIEPLSIPSKSSEYERIRHKEYLDSIVKILGKYDIVIIDTVSEVIGNASETEDDRIIKSVFQYIAENSNVSILLVHHVNKEQIRGAKIDMASGAGLTSIMRLSTCILALTKKDTLSLEYLKANDLERN